MSERQVWIEQAESLCTKLSHIAGYLNEYLADQLDAEGHLELLTQRKEAREAEALLRETCKEGAINGPNSDTRKHQATLLLTELAAHDEEYSEILREHRETEEELRQAKLDVQQAANTFGALKHRARLIEAVLNSLS